MFLFNKIYRPITARPFLSDKSYMEYPPCERLSPYVTCYWTEDGERVGKIGKENGILIIPDTCMDILVQINHTRNTVSGGLCALQDEPGIAAARKGTDKISYFAIRFYFWAASLFIDHNFQGTCNGMVELDALGSDWKKLFDMFFYITDVNGRIVLTEEFLLRKLDGREVDPRLFNSVYKILNTSGREAVKEVCEFACVSQRQMERICLREVGVPLKRISNLVRYQNVWKEMVLSRDFDVQDAVYRYGYTDQPHLLKEFKRFHGLSPEEARRFAYHNQ